MCQPRNTVDWFESTIIVKRSVYCRSMTNNEIDEKIPYIIRKRSCTWRRFRWLSVGRPIPMLYGRRNLYISMHDACFVYWTLNTLLKSFTMDLCKWNEKKELFSFCWLLNDNDYRISLNFMAFFTDLLNIMQCWRRSQNASRKVYVK